MNKIEMLKMQDFIKWTSSKIELHQRNSSASKMVLQSGQVYECELGMGVGCGKERKDQ